MPDVVPPRRMQQEREPSARDTSIIPRLPRELAAVRKSAGLLEPGPPIGRHRAYLLAKSRRTTHPLPGCPQYTDLATGGRSSPKQRQTGSGSWTPPGNNRPAGGRGAGTEGIKTPCPHNARFASFQATLASPLTRTGQRLGHLLPRGERAFTECRSSFKWLKCYRHSKSRRVPILPGFRGLLPAPERAKVELSGT